MAGTVSRLSVQTLGIRSIPLCCLLPSPIRLRNSLVSKFLINSSQERLFYGLDVSVEDFHASRGLGTSVIAVLEQRKAAMEEDCDGSAWSKPELHLHLPGCKFPTSSIERRGPSFALLLLQNTFMGGESANTHRAKWCRRVGSACTNGAGSVCPHRLHQQSTSQRRNCPFRVSQLAGVGSLRLHEAVRRASCRMSDALLVSQ